MRITSSYICLKGVRFHAFHGVLPQERTVGNDFMVDLRIGYPLEQAIASDEVTDTLNYATVYETVKREMSIPSQLIEHVDADEFTSCSAAFTYLDEHVRTACQYLCFRVFLKKPDGILYAFSFIQCFYVVHTTCSPFPVPLFSMDRL